MRKTLRLKAGRRVAAFALATMMLGSTASVPALPNGSGEITVSAASKFTFDGKNLSKYEGAKTFVVSKNITNSSLGAIKKAYKKNESLFLKVKRLEFGNDVTTISADVLSYFPNTTTLVMGKKVADIPESDGFTVDGEEILTKLTKIEVDAKNTEYSAKDGILYNKKKTSVVKVPVAYAKNAYNMPSTIKKLASDYALNQCPKVKSLTLSKSFEGKLSKLNRMTSLSKIAVSAGNTDYVAINGVLYSADQTKLISWPAADKTKTVILPSTIKELNVDVLPKTVTTLTLPKSLTTLYSEDKSSDYNPKKYPLNALPELTQITVEDGNEYFAVDGGGLYNTKKTVCYGIPMKTAVTDIAIPEGMESIESRLLYNHKTITSISIPETLKTENAANVLGGANTLTSLTAYTVAEKNESLKAIDGVLYSADEKELFVYPIAKAGSEYVIPDTVEKVHANAFSSSCKNITKITIGKNVSDIVQGMDLPNLTEYVVSDENASFCARNGVLYLKNLSAICGYPRKKTDKTFEIESSVENMEYYNSFKSDYLKELDIQGEIDEFPSDFNINVPKIESITAGSDSGFKAKNGVLYTSTLKSLVCYPCAKDSTSFIVPETVTKIFSGAIINNKNLKKITLGKNLSVFYTDTFRGCKKLATIDVDKNNKTFCSDNGVVYNKKMTTLCCYPAGKKGKTLTLPKTVTKISMLADFMLENKNLKKIKVAKDNKTLVSDGKTITNVKTKSVVFTLIPSEDEE